MKKIFLRPFSISWHFPQTKKHFLGRLKNIKTPIPFIATIVFFVLLSFEPTLAGAPPIQWQKTFGGNNNDSGSSVQQTTDGGYIITGSMWSYGVGYNDVYLIKTDLSGNTEWQKTFGGSDLDVGDSVQQTSDGGYIIAGGTELYGAGSGDVYLVKLCSDGTLSADFNCNGTVYFEDLNIMVGQWLQPPGILSADIAPEMGDGIVNFLDFRLLANDWLQTTIP